MYLLRPKSKQPLHTKDIWLPTQSMGLTRAKPPVENQGRSQTASTWVHGFIQHPADQGPRTKAVLTLTSPRPSNWNSPNKVLAATSVYPPTLSPGLKKHSCTGCFPGRRANLQATWCPWLSSRVQLEVQEFKAMGGKVYRDYFLMAFFFSPT